MNTSEQIGEIALALAKVQGKIKDAGKDRKGFNYQYADLAQILQITRPILSENGIALLQDAAVNESMVEVTTRLIHQSGQWIEAGPLVMNAEPKKGLSQAQCVGSVVTYARRYALAALIGITQEDDDGSSAAEAPATLTKVQIEKITDLCKQADFDPANLATAYKVGSLEEIPADRFQSISKRLIERAKMDQAA